MLIFNLLMVASADPTCPADVNWLEGDWDDISGEISTDKAAEIAALEEYAFTLEGENADRQGIRTDGMLIVQHGQRTRIR